MNDAEPQIRAMVDVWCPTCEDTIGEQVIEGVAPWIFLDCPACKARYEVRIEIEES